MLFKEVFSIMGIAGNGDSDKQDNSLHREIPFLDNYCFGVIIALQKEEKEILTGGQQNGL